MESVQGTLDGVWLNEDEDGKPARLKLMGEYYSTFTKEMLAGFQPDDLVEIQYHIEKGKFKTIDSIVHIRETESKEKPKNKSIYIEEAKMEINKILDKLGENVDGT